MFIHVKNDLQTFLILPKMCISLVGRKITRSREEVSQYSSRHPFCTSSSICIFADSLCVKMCMSGAFQQIILINLAPSHEQIIKLMIRHAFRPAWAVGIGPGNNDGETQAGVAFHLLTLEKCSWYHHSSSPGS